MSATPAASRSLQLWMYPTSPWKIGAKVLEGWVSSEMMAWGMGDGVLPASEGNHLHTFHLLGFNHIGGGKMAQWVEMPVAKLDDLSDHTMEGENRHLQIVL